MNIRLERVSVDLPAAGRRLFHVDALSLPTGARALIHGASGRGKTTLLHLIAGLLLPSHGQVWLGDQELTALADRERTRLRRAHLGIVFQKHNLLEHLTASENVELALPRARSARERAAEALARVGLEQAASQRTSELSLGEQQRVAIARVLAAKPRVLLADEPTSSLDRVNAERVIDLLLDESGAETVVVVSHDERIHQRFTTLFDFTEWCPA